MTKNYSKTRTKIYKINYRANRTICLPNFISKSHEHPHSLSFVNLGLRIRRYLKTRKPLNIFESKSSFRQLSFPFQ
ncbi:unnamed protein product [Meloidogyne enterolobii]|uniref:Uncharacterized protein n=1 Tax=Meloidogyne enterolobii TaxID=390850 RepID=A0ACB0ZHR3_MELEN